MEEKARYHRETVNGCAFRMRYLPGGIFDMGSDKTRFIIEKPIHKVKLSSFYIGEYLVTQALWKAVMGTNNNPSRFIGDHRPVEQVSLIDIAKVSRNDSQSTFMKKLNEATEVTRPSGYKYRLPTEAEWEYAARGGEPYDYAGSDLLKETGWYNENSHRETKDVGLKHANGFFLYDMSGNVNEWCMDTYSDTFYQECNNNGIVKDPLCKDENTKFHVFRGGSWLGASNYCGVSSRLYLNAKVRDYDVGFRLVLASS